VVDEDNRQAVVKVQRVMKPPHEWLLELQSEVVLPDTYILVN